MSGLVQVVFDTVSRRCHTSDCGRDGCDVQMDGVPDPHVVVDLDCEPLGLLDQKRCDLLFVGEDDDEAWVAPIELKSGRFTGYQVVKQLQGGADAADGWLPDGSAFRFVPVLDSWKRSSQERSQGAAEQEGHAARPHKTNRADALR